MIKIRLKKLLLISLFSIFSIPLLMTGFLASAHAENSVNIGDIFTVDMTSETVVKVNPVTGDRTIVSNFLNPSQGPAGDEPRDLFMDPDGNLCVLDSDGGTDDRGLVLRVHPITGDRTTLSDLGDPAQGLTPITPHNISLFTNGTVYISYDRNPNSDGSLLVVDKTTGNRTLLSDLSDPGQGQTADSPYKMVEGPGGTIYLVTRGGGMGDDGFIFDVNPANGNRTVVSELGDPVQGPVATNNLWIAANPTGGPIYLLVNANPALLMMVDPGTGFRTIISDFDNPGQGPTNDNVAGLTIEEDGQLLVNGRTPDLLYRIDPVTGFRTVISDSSVASQGPPIQTGVGITIATVASSIQVPTLSVWGLIATAAFLGIISFIIIRRRNAVA